MLKKITRIFGRQTKKNRQVIPGSELDIHPERVSKGARHVISHLQEAGHLAYLVGGGVRDLLLDGHPKDFDIATDATPEQVRGLFRSARIIGRRFRIVHVRFGREVIEVTTFRAHPDEGKTSEASQSERGVLLRDNVYGGIESDALRRDFSVNALYYDSTKDELFDFTGGLTDLRRRTLRLIGDPDRRYKEDPVRMLRAVRFAAKLGFKLEAKTEQPIRAHADYLTEIPSARLFEEVLKLMLSGYSLASFNMLQSFGLFQYLFPGTHRCLTQASRDAQQAQAFLEQMASNTDRRIRTQKRVTPAFFYAAFLWLPLRETKAMIKQKQPEKPAQEIMQIASSKIINEQLMTTAIPKRFLIPMREIWDLQTRLQKRDSLKALQLIEHPRFRAAYDFLLLREQSGEMENGLGTWWTNFQEADRSTQEEMISEQRPTRRRRKRRKRKPVHAYQNSE